MSGDNIGLIIGIVIGVVVFLLISVVLVMCIILKCSLSQHACMKENKFRMNEYIAEMTLKDKLKQVNGQGTLLMLDFR